MRLTGSRLTDSVVYQEPVRVTDAYGETSESWQDVLTLWADVRAQSGVERMRAGQIEAVELYIVKARYHSQITTKGRLIYNGKALEIHSAAPLDRGWMEMTCSRSQ
jgi:SPP1 family predicted phage head-tail adaptor